jgi:hypothetical protein
MPQCRTIEEMATTGDGRGASRPNSEPGREAPEAGESASFAVFTIDREKLVYWMPSLFRAFATEREAERAAHIAGLEFIEHLD